MRIYSSHALKRMFERGISPDDVEEALVKGQVIQNYPEEKPIPEMLVFGKAKKRILHIVLAVDQENGMEYIITVYEPNPQRWNGDFRRRTE